MGTNVLRDIDKIQYQRLEISRVQRILKFVFVTRVSIVPSGKLILR